jgi:uncharacterized surface protein with fasciclin (FAS1) repeats
VKKLGVAALAALLLIGGAVTTVRAQEPPMVGGSLMYPTKNIIQNAVNSKDHTTLVALVKQAGLVQTLEGPGPFTVFAPTNEAFAKVPKPMMNQVMNDNTMLTKILTYHVVPGRVTTDDIEQMIKAGGGSAKLKTVQGDYLTATMSGSNIVIADDHGNKGVITIADVMQSNGVIQVINAVMMP